MVIGCASHTGVEWSHCGGAALGGQSFRRGLPWCAHVVLAAVTPVRDMPYEFTGPCCVSRMCVLWISVAGINGEGSGGSAATVHA